MSAFSKHLHPKQPKCLSARKWDYLKLSLTFALAVLLTASTSLLGQGSRAEAEPNFDTGVKYYKKGDYRAAVQSFNKVGNAGSQPTVIYYQALCNQQMGNTQNALQLYRKVNSNFPASPEARFAQQYLRSVGDASVPRNLVGAVSTGGGGANVQRSAYVSAATSMASRDHLPDSCGVPFHRAPGDHMLLNAIVGGRTMEVMFDTGAASSYFGRDQLTAAGAKFYPTGQKGQSQGVGGLVDIEICMCEVRLGDITRTVPLMVAATHSMTPLLGQTFFNPFRYDIDTSAGIIHFYKKGGVRSEGFDTLNVPFTAIGNELEVVCTINGRQGKAFFDTGAGCTLFSMQQLESMGIQVPRDNPCMVSGVGGGNVAYRFRVDRLALGPVQKSNMEIVASPSCSMSLIGQDFFKDKRFSIDNEAHVIKFVH